MAFGGFSWSASQPFTPGPTVVMHANWIHQKASLREAYRDAQLALIAVPVAAESYKLHAMVFTDDSVRVIQRLKGTPPPHLRVTLTGGDWEGVRYRVEGQPLLQVGRPYLMLLQKQFPDDPNDFRYTAVGGYQGFIQLNPQAQADVDAAPRWTAVAFNPDNNLERQVQGQDVLAALDVSP